MDEVEADAAAGTQLCEECGKPVPPPDPGARPGRPRKYCGRGCQSKVYRRKKEQARQQQLQDALAVARVETHAVDPGREAAQHPASPLTLAAAMADAGAPDEDLEDGLDEDLGDNGEAGPGEDATARELVRWHADQTALHAGYFLRNLDDGYDPDQDRALRHLTYYASVHTTKMFQAARQARDALRPPRPAGAIASWAEGLEEFAQMVAWKDPAALPDVHLAQHAAADTDTQEPPSADPVFRLGYPTLILHLAPDPERWDDWDIAGWKLDQDNILVRHRRLVAGRAEKVGTRWLAVVERHYLREGLGSSSHKLRWFDTALDAAAAVALWHQAQWEETDPVLTWHRR